MYRAEAGTAAGPVRGMRARAQSSSSPCPENTAGCTAHLAGSRVRVSGPQITASFKRQKRERGHPAIYLPRESRIVRPSRLHRNRAQWPAVKKGSWWLASADQPGRSPDALECQAAVGPGAAAPIIHAEDYHSDTSNQTYTRTTHNLGWRVSHDGQVPPLRRLGIRKKDRDQPSAPRLFFGWQGRCLDEISARHKKHYHHITGPRRQGALSSDQVHKNSRRPDRRTDADRTH